MAKPQCKAESNWKCWLDECRKWLGRDGSYEKLMLKRSGRRYNRLVERKLTKELD